MQTTLVGVLILFVLSYSVSSRRALQEIRYHFTTCGKEGRHGPTYNECLKHYASANSRIHQQNVLQESINSTPPAPVFNGVQIFKVPRFGLYNITVAGAAGASGICNTELGHGIIRSIQVELDPSLNLVLMVGQHGLAYCDTEPFFPLCMNKKERNFTLASCNAEWYTNLEMTYPDQNISKMLGGGGGGGASMIIGYHSLLGFNSDPLVIAAGGGGTSAILADSNVAEILGINNNSSYELDYKTFINAHSSSINSFEFATRIRHLNALTSAGIGGSYYARANNRKPVDGGQLSQPDSFAVGGLDCVQSILSNTSKHDNINGSYGGFGGGGGGCAGGGGGGGYLGGSVLGADQTIPGSGGLSSIGSPFATTFKFIGFIGDQLNEDLDGYIDIVDADCECIFTCDIYKEDDEFECICPGMTLLAPDGSDCYIEVVETVTEEPLQMLPPNQDGISFFYKQLKFKNRIYLYSINFEVTVDPLRELDYDEPETIYERCIVGFLGEKNEVLAFSDVHSRSVQVLNTLEPVINNERAEHVRFLDSPVLVYSALVVSAGNCTINNMTLLLNVSIRDRSFDEISVVDGGVVSEAINELFIISASNMMQAVSTPLAVSNKSRNIGIGAGVVLFVLFIAVLASVLICTFIICLRNSTNGLSQGKKQPSKLSIIGSLKESGISESFNFPYINGSYITLTTTEKSSKCQTL